MENIEIKEKKTRKPRMAKVVATIVKQQSMRMESPDEEVARITLKEDPVGHKDVGELRLEVIEPVKVKIEEVELVTETPEPLVCQACNKTFKRNYPSVIDRHNRSIYHKQAVLRNEIKSQA